MFTPPIKLNRPEGEQVLDLFVDHGLNERESTPRFGRVEVAVARRGYRMFQPFDPIYKVSRSDRTGRDFFDDIESNFKPIAKLAFHYLNGFNYCPSIRTT